MGRCSSRQKAEVHLFTAADPLILASTCLLKAGKQCCYCWGFEFTVVAKMQKYSKRHGLSTCARVHIAVLLWQSRMILKIVSLLHFPHFFCCERNQILRSRRLVKPDAYMPIILFLGLYQSLWWQRAGSLPCLQDGKTNQSVMLY